MGPRVLLFRPVVFRNHRDDSRMNSPGSSVLKASTRHAILDALDSYGHRQLHHRHDRFGVGWSVDEDDGLRA